MSILSRYLIRLHVVPFVFALGALTSLMLLNQIAKRFGDLAGKGLPWGVIVEVFALSIPFIVAMTLPMAVLVAVLYASTRLAADSEVTALRAGGVSLWRILRPLLLGGAGLTLLAFAFSDHILPRTNHRLRTLYSDIARKKPTFSLKEQVINEVQRSRLFLRAAAIDRATYALADVTIYDLADQDRKRVIYADSGYLAITEDQEDAYLTLFSGVMHEFDRQDPQMFQLVGFSRDLVRIEGVGNELRRTLDDSYKGDREMSICEMERSVAAARRAETLARRRAVAARITALYALVDLPGVEPDTMIKEAPLSPYCRALTSWASWLLPPELAAQPPPRQDSLRRFPGARRRPETPVARGVPPGLRTSELRAHEDRARISQTRAAHFLVEIHKKYAIASACLVFVLLGVPTAIRFPRGGLGFVIGVSLVIFAVYYIGLIGGESLADRLVAPPWILWTPNILFTLAGIVLLRRSRTAATAPSASGLRMRVAGAWRRLAG
jgi:lipopolysaccharide export system permease protein